jgi:uncharacterized protein YcbX
MFEPMYNITQLNIYPIKGMAGIDLNEAYFSSSSFLFDINCMLVDKHVIFGMNLIAINENGTIRLGDPLVPLL